MKNDILNYLGEKIGELELPDDATEQAWAEKLEAYAAPLVTKTVETVSARQLRQAIVLSGMTMAQVDGILDSLPEPRRALALISWEYSTEFIRHTDLVDFVGLSVGLSSDQIDDIWLLAASL